jgi:hypothetical protein
MHGLRNLGTVPKESRDDTVHCGGKRGTKSKKLTADETGVTSLHSLTIEPPITAASCPVTTSKFDHRLQFTIDFRHMLPYYDNFDN